MMETELPQALQLLVRFDDLVDPESSTEVLTNLTRLISETQPDEAKHRANIVAVLEQIPRCVQQADGSSVEAVQQALEGKRQERPNEGEALLSAQLMLLDHLPSERVAAVSQALESFLGNGSPEAIDRLVRKEAEATSELIPAGAWYGPLRSRLSQNPKEEDAYLLVGSLLDVGRLRDDRDEAVGVLAKCLRDSAQPGWRATLRAGSRELRPRRHLTRPVADKPLVERLIEATLEGARANPNAAVAPAVTLVLDLVEQWDCCQEVVLEKARTFLDLNTQEGAQLATELLTKGMERALFPDAELNASMDSIVHRLNQTSPSSIEHARLLLDCLMMLAARLSRWDDAFVVVRGFSRPTGARPNHLPEDYRSLGYDKVGQFKELPRGMEEVHLSQLLDEARSEPEPLRSEILKCLVALRESGVRRRSPVWKEARTFFSAAGSGYDRFVQQL